MTADPAAIAARAATIRHKYLDRAGRQIVDPYSIVARYVQQQLARLSALAYRAGTFGDCAVTAGQLADTCRMPVEHIVYLFRNEHVWGGITERGDDQRQWGVWLDGE